MRKVYENLKSNKYITLFFAVMLMFAYMGGSRKYIYDNCSKILDFARMGSAWFNLSIGISLLMALAVCAGVAITFLLRKKITMDWIIPAYGVAAVVSAITLAINPYNLQLLSPSTHMDAFATLTLIVAMVFSLVIVALLSASISAHILLVTHEGKMIATIISGAEMAFAILFAILSVALDWSVQIYLVVLTVLLILFYALNAFDRNEEKKLCVADAKINWLWLGITIAIAIIAIIAVLASSAVIVENAIKF